MPNLNDESDWIKILGKKDSVNKLANFLLTYEKEMIVEKFSLDIDASDIGRFVGSNQSYITEIENETDTFIYVKRPNQDAGQKDTVVEITGKSADVDIAMFKILDRSSQIGELESRSSQGQSCKLQPENRSRSMITKRAGEYTIKHRVPVCHHSIFMGPGGREAKRLEISLRIRIHFPRNKNKNDFKSDDFIELTGTEDNLRRAKEYFDRASQSYTDLNNLRNKKR
jgi:hypothetical protein